MVAKFLFKHVKNEYTPHHFKKVMEQKPTLITSASAMTGAAQSARGAGQTIALVPTMGALHDGHLRLVREAADHADAVIVSVFVNPTQFGPSEDYDRYPREIDGDRELLAREGTAAILFAPGVEDMYPRGIAGQKTWVDTSALDGVLCGRFRPGHFRGVATIVAKLFNICKPDIGVFGRKDAQQFVILQRMVADLGFSVSLVGVPTVRDSDGLALSSRNAYLSPRERSAALALPRAIGVAESMIASGARSVADIEAAMLEELSAEPGVRAQYAEVVDAGDLATTETIAPGQHMVAAIAGFVGETRLIDSAFATSPPDLLRSSRMPR